MSSILEELFLFLNRDVSNKSYSLTSFVVGAILSISIVLAVFELNWILSLLSPIKFLLLCSAVGIPLGFLLYLLLSIVGLIESEWKVFWIILLSGVLLTNFLSSRFNRSGLSDAESIIQAIIIRQPQIGGTMSRIPIRMKDLEFVIRTDVETGKALRIGDTIPIIRYNGKLNFDILSHKKVFANPINE